MTRFLVKISMRNKIDKKAEGVFAGVPWPPSFGPLVDYLRR
jgi:hypothetical protein